MPGALRVDVLVHGDDLGRHEGKRMPGIQVDVQQ
jgi:hypothetical protein